MTLDFLIVQNEKGETQLARWWLHLTNDLRRSYEERVRHELTKNIIFAKIEVPLINRPDERLQKVASDNRATLMTTTALPIVMRHLGNLRCAIGYKEGSENPVAVCEFINLYFECMHKYFRKARLDIQRNVPHALRLLEEFVQAGEICETDPTLAISNVKSLSKLPKT